MVTALPLVGFAVLFIGCAMNSSAVTVQQWPKEFGARSCMITDSQPGPIWHKPVEFVICRNDDSGLFSPPMLGQDDAQNPLDMLTNPIQTGAEKLVIPVAP